MPKVTTMSPSPMTILPVPNEQTQPYGDGTREGKLMTILKHRTAWEPNHAYTS